MKTVTDQERHATTLDKNGLPLTRDFKETVRARLRRDPEFRRELLKEALRCMLDGEAVVGRMLMRDYIIGAMGFSELARRTGKRRESLMRMFSHKGNPQANNLFAAIKAMADHEGIEMDVECKRKRAEEATAVDIAA